MTMAVEAANSKLVEVDAEKRVDNSWVLNFVHNLSTRFDQDFEVEAQARF